MNTLTQLELILNQLYNCSAQISQCIETENLEELSSALGVKDKILEKIEQMKKTSPNWDLSAFSEVITKIEKNELSNIEKIKQSKQKIREELTAHSKTSKLINTYEPQNQTSGNILDMSE